MTGTLMHAWQAILDHPLFWVGATLAAYQLGLALYQRTRLALFHPVLVSTPVLVLAIWLAGEDYPHYRDAVQPLLVLLGPATVALAVPLYMNLKRIRSYLVPVLTCLLVGGTFATVLAIVLAWALGAEDMIMMTLAPKSVTSPIAMLVADQIGGIAALAAVFVMITGVIGAIVGPSILRLCRVHHPAAQGMALGITAHAVGTARALQESDECGAFAALAMSLMGVITAVLLPLAIALLL